MRRSKRSNKAAVSRCANNVRYHTEDFMLPGFLMWLLGVPLSLIVILWLFGFLS